MTHREDDELHEAHEPVPVNGPPIRPSAVAPGPQPTAAPRELADVLNEAFELMRARSAGEEKPITTPWPDFDAALDGGLWPGCHVLVSGTGSGKSTLALQLALHTARQQQTRVVYVALELDEPQIALRLAGELAGVSWSRLYNGKALDEERARALSVREQLATLPIFIETGAAIGWPASRMAVVAEQVRALYPNGPLLFVLDFLQLIGNEPTEKLDLRERIGRAAYAARDIARRYKATALLICSVARNHYTSVTGLESLEAARLAADEAHGILIEHFMLSPDALVGLGKESGEIEYAADSVTVAISLPNERVQSSRDVVLAVAKLRAGRPSWCVLEFTGSRFETKSDQGRSVLRQLEELHQEQGRHGPKPRRPESKGNNGKRFDT